MPIIFLIPFEVALIAYDPETNFQDEPLLKIRYSVVSPSFKHFAYLPPHQEVSRESEIYNTLPEPLEIVKTRLEIEDTFSSKNKIFQGEAFSNTYKVFELITDEVALQ